MKQNETNLVPKSSEKYFCQTCHYNTSRKSQYDRHISTRKHKMNQNVTILVPKSSAAIIVLKIKMTNLS